MKALFTLPTLALIYGHHCYSSSQQTSTERLYVLLNLTQCSPFCSSKDNIILFWAEDSTENSFITAREFFSETLLLMENFTRRGFVIMTLIFLFLLLDLKYRCIITLIYLLVCFVVFSFPRHSAERLWEPMSSNLAYDPC